MVQACFDHKIYSDLQEIKYKVLWRKVYYDFWDNKLCGKYVYEKI